MFKTMNVYMKNFYIWKRKRKKQKKNSRSMGKGYQWAVH